MRVRLLPSGGVGDPRGQYLTSFIINDSMAIDAGSLVLGINRLSQLLIRKVVITHSHLDHHVGLPLLLDNIFSDMSECVTVYSTEETIDALKNHIFNNLIWPDFSSFSNSNGASLKFEVVEPYRCFAVDELKLTLVPVNHTVPTVGLILEDRHSAIAISS
ncbi:MAG: 3',5'-cyclic-nucleotide phosphodiesterase, partial [Blastocatellia bacterium]|nr:3',5'-cyclic-nucleotide phosphodiesterase [Blastocatellia bacterium]